MNQYSEPKLEYNSVYHIFNCGIDGCNIFVDDEDYDRFLSKFTKYIEPIADTYAWSLLGNHFHVVARIKKESELKTLEELGLYEEKTNIRTPEKKPDPVKQFSHLFNSYAQYFNYKYKRHGTLFERPFKRKLIDNRVYFKRCLLYVHQNPVKHGFVERLSDYRYTSFNTILSEKATLLKREKVLSLFENHSDFVLTHAKLIELDETFD
jgi:putative transposase